MFIKLSLVLFLSIGVILGAQDDFEKAEIDQLLREACSCKVHNEYFLSLNLGDYRANKEVTKTPSTLDQFLMTAKCNLTNTESLYFHSPNYYVCNPGFTLTDFLITIGDVDSIISNVNYEDWFVSLFFQEFNIFDRLATKTIRIIDLISYLDISLTIFFKIHKHENWQPFCKNEIFKKVRNIFFKRDSQVFISDNFLVFSPLSPCITMRMRYHYGITYV